MKGNAAASPMNAINPPATKELRDVGGTRLLMLQMQSCIKVKLRQDASWACLLKGSVAAHQRKGAEVAGQGD